MDKSYDITKKVTLKMLIIWNYFEVKDLFQ